MWKRNPLHLRLRATGGGEGRRLSLENPPHLEELRVIRLLDGNEETERVIQGIAEVGNGECAVASTLDHPSGLEHPERLAHGGASDAERLDQLALGRESLARLEAPRADLGHQPLGYELVRLPAMNRTRLFVRQRRRDTTTPRRRAPRRPTRDCQTACFEERLWLRPRLRVWRSPRCSASA